MPIELLQRQNLASVTRFGCGKPALVSQTSRHTAYGTDKLLSWLVKTKKIIRRHQSVAGDPASWTVVATDLNRTGMKKAPRDPRRDRTRRLIGALVTSLTTASRSTPRSRRRPFPATILIGRTAADMILEDVRAGTSRLTRQ